MMKCLNCNLEISNYLGIQSLEPTNPPGWVEAVVHPVQLCFNCAVKHFNQLNIVEWDDEE
jgi:hypothetical protein